MVRTWLSNPNCGTLIQYQKDKSPVKQNKIQQCAMKQPSSIQRHPIVNRKLTVGGVDEAGSGAQLSRPLLLVVVALLLVLVFLLQVAVRFGAEAFEHLAPILRHTSARLRQLFSSHPPTRTRVRALVHSGQSTSSISHQLFFFFFFFDFLLWIGSSRVI